GWEDVRRRHRAGGRAAGGRPDESVRSDGIVARVEQQRRRQDRVIVAGGAIGPMPEFDGALARKIATGSPLIGATARAGARVRGGCGETKAIPAAAIGMAVAVSRPSPVKTQSNTNC